jgi:hypothetical protein
LIIRTVRNRRLSSPKIPAGSEADPVSGTSKVGQTLANPVPPNPRKQAKDPRITTQTLPSQVLSWKKPPNTARIAVFQLLKRKWSLQARNPMNIGGQKDDQGAPSPAGGDGEAKSSGGGGKSGPAVPSRSRQETLKKVQALHLCGKNPH